MIASTRRNFSYARLRLRRWSIAQIADLSRQDKIMQRTKISNWQWCQNGQM